MENRNFKIDCPESLINISQKIFEDLEKKKEIIFDFFGINDFQKVNIILFDSKSAYDKFFENDTKMPKYSTGCIKGNSIYAVIDLRSVNNVDKYEKNANEGKNISRVTHEFFHIIYNNRIVKEKKQKRCTWLDEGLAQCLSGQNDILEKGDNFKNYFINVVKSTKEIPNLNSLVHRVVNSNDKPFKSVGIYDGYALSFISVRYMLEVFGKQKVREIMENEEQLLEVGNTVIKESFKYFKEKYLIQSKKDKDEEVLL